MSRSWVSFQSVKNVIKLDLVAQFCVDTKSY